MPKLQTVTNNLTAGEFTPRLRSRVDLEKYNASAEKLQNCVVLRHGGATMRPSLDFVGAVKDSTQTVRIFPFVYSRTDSFLLEMGTNYMRVWKNGALVESSPGTPFEAATPWTDAQLASVNYTQGADTMILAHPSVYPQRIRRFADAKWVVDFCPFKPGAVYENGHRSNTVNMTISNVAVGTGRTVTASASYFLEGDKGRNIAWGVGTAKITAIVSATQATVTVETAFDASSATGPDWVLAGSPQVAIDPDGPSPIGRSITIISDAGIPCFRAEDVGKIIRLNGGVVEITKFTSSTSIGAIIKQALTTEAHAKTATWTMEGPAWTADNGYPYAVALYQQRLWFGGNFKFPQTAWGSRSALFFDFTPGTDDDSAVYKTIDSDTVNIVQHLASIDTLTALTYGGEFEIKGGVERPVTQSNAQITGISTWGCDLAKPLTVGRDLLVVQRGGKAVRRLKRDLDSLALNDISVYSEHLFAAGIKCMTWEQTPEQVAWIATNDGKLVALTYSDEQNIAAFCSGEASGFVEWLATIPEGAVDATYALVRRTIDGNTVRYIERLNWAANPGQDSRKEVTGAASAVWAGFDHLEGQTVQCLADDVYVGTAVVTGGEITLPRPATKLSAGIGYSARIRLQAPEVGTGTGTAQGQAQSTHQIAVRFLNTVGCKVNGEDLAFRQFGENVLDQPVQQFTGLKSVTNLGWENGESPIEIVQDQPYPWTVLAVIRNFTVNQG